MQHVVLLKVKEDAPLEAQKAMVEAIVALKNVVPGIVSIEVGETFTHERSRGFTHLLSVRLDSRQRLAEYAAHPEHLRVLEEHIKPIVDDVCALDAECPRHEVSWWAAPLATLTAVAVALSVGFALGHQSAARSSQPRA